MHAVVCACSPAWSVLWQSAVTHVAGDSVAKSQDAPSGDATKDTASEGAAAAKNAASNGAAAAKDAASEGAKLASKAGRYLLRAVTPVHHFIHIKVAWLHVVTGCQQSSLINPLAECDHLLQVTQLPKVKMHLAVRLPRRLLQKVQLQASLVSRFSRA